MLPSKQNNDQRFKRSPAPVSPNPLERRFENDEDVDVEQCSDGEDERSHNGDPKNSSNGISQSRSPGGPPSSNNNNEIVMIKEITNGHNLKNKIAYMI